MKRWIHASESINNLSVEDVLNMPENWTSIDWASTPDFDYPKELTQAYVARHSTDSKMLYALSDSNNAQVIENIVINPNTPIQVIDKLVDEINTEGRSAGRYKFRYFNSGIEQNTILTLPVLKKLCQKGLFEECCMNASTEKNMQLKDAILQYFIKNGEKYVSDYRDYSAPLLHIIERSNKLSKNSMYELYDKIIDPNFDLTHLGLLTILERKDCPKDLLYKMYQDIQTNAISNIDDEQKHILLNELLHNKEFIRTYPELLGDRFDKKKSKAANKNKSTKQNNSSAESEYIEWVD